MRDFYGRNINYMRVSLTDRCNLRCQYCMPRGVQKMEHGDILRYVETLRICEAAVSLGITRFKVTGGEPLVRRGSTDFIARLKALPGVEQVTLTTNGLLLAENLDALCAAGLDGVNISLDTLRPARYAALTGSEAPVDSWFPALLDECLARGLRTRVNTVLLQGTFDEIEQIAALAEKRPVDVRFIELMPIGEGRGMAGVPLEWAFAQLQSVWPGLSPVAGRRGNGPAEYFAAPGLEGCLGFIGAVSRRFCSGCNRVRLTAGGQLKPCLCYEAGTDLRALLRGGCRDEHLRKALREAILQKPESHCFSRRESITEHRAMHQIGG